MIIVLVLNTNSHISTTTSSHNPAPPLLPSDPTLVAKYVKRAKQMLLQSGDYKKQKREEIIEDLEDLATPVSVEEVAAGSSAGSSAGLQGDGRDNKKVPREKGSSMEPIGFPAIKCDAPLQDDGLVILPLLITQSPPPTLSFPLSFPHTFIYIIS